ncbi:MAG: DUF547 domain-containing protein [Candidatus Obscuribacterales bacterium]|nr:DUF547 domain-containing protein [Candidatus Obscuribacterales bacterium]
MNPTATDHIQNFPEPQYKNCALRPQLLSCLLSIASLLSLSRAEAFDQSHRAFTSELRKYVQTNGVQYGKWKNKRQGLDKYLSSLCELSEDEYKKFSKLEKRALWINAYNALAIRLVIDNYPIKGVRPDYPASSIRQIPNAWEAAHAKIAGREVSLYTIAHDLLRKSRDCRAHFAMVPASRSAPELRARAFQAKDIEKELDKITKDYLSKPENLRYDPDSQTLTVSQIFKWFPLDFIKSVDGKIPMPPPRDDEVVKNYVQDFLPESSRAKMSDKEIKINYSPYDWSLNDAAAPKTAEIIDSDTLLQ